VLLGIERSSERGMGWTIDLLGRIDRHRMRQWFVG